MNIKSKFLLFFIAIMAGYSFSNMYNTYVELDLVEKIFENNAPISMDASSNINNYESLAKSEGVVLFLSENNTKGFYIYYYNPTSNSEFINIMENYNKKCYKNCVNFIEKDLDEFTSRTIDIELFSSNTLTTDIYNEYNIQVSNMEIPDDQDDNLALLKLHFHISIVTTILTIFALVCLLTTELTKNIEKMNLYSTYGFSFKSLIKDWNKSFLISYLILYLSVFNVVCLVIIKNLYFVKLGLIYNIFIIVVTYLIFIATAFYFYNKTRKEYQFEYIKNSIWFLGIILAVLTAFSIYFIDNTITYYKTSSAINDAFDNNSEYYYLAHDVSIDDETSSKAAKDLIDNYGGVFRQYNDFDPKSTPILTSDYSIFYEKGLIYDIKDNPITYDDSKNILYYVDKEKLDSLNNIEFYDKVQIKDNGKEYDTLSPFTTTVELKDIVLIPYGAESLYVSNIYIKSDDKEKAKEIFDHVYKTNNISSDVSVLELGQTQFKNQASKTYRENVIASIVSIASILIAITFYTLLVFQKNKDKILISNIFGQSYFNRMHCVIKDFLVVWLLTLVVMVIAGINAISLYFFIFIFQYIIMDSYIRSLTKKSVAQYIKEEM